MECQKCKKVLGKKGLHFVCQGPCEGVFHRGCVKGLLADLKIGRVRNYCNNCEDEGSDDENQNEGQDQEDMSKILKDIQKKVACIPSLKQQLEGICDSLNVLSDKYDTLIAEHEKSKSKITKLEKAVTTVSNKCVYLEKHNTALEQKLLEFEQASRNHNIEIVGIEQLPGENVKDIVIKIGNKLNVDCTDIEWARRSRVPKVGSTKPAPILVGFKATGTGTRDNWLAQRRNLLDTTSDVITGGSVKNKIYINEDLTKTTRALLWNTKKQLLGIFKYIWISNGKILVKKTDGEKSICVRAESDIDDLIKTK
ncbi:hypothetical protein O0L34_g15662 [Tuta absoluta]|nr:hypothetical protein O0L34_g15662 [Tuta absoluta]